MDLLNRDTPQSVVDAWDTAVLVGALIVSLPMLQPPVTVRDVGLSTVVGQLFLTIVWHVRRVDCDGGGGLAVEDEQ